MSVLDIIRPELQTIDAYTPKGDNIPCRLHNNELPWSPLADYSMTLNNYPDRENQGVLQDMLARNYQIRPSQLLITRGSDDGIDLLMRLFLSEGKNSILQCPPTFPMYAFYAQLQNARIINCPLDETNGFTLSTEALFSAWKPDCKLIMLCQPNNPTGNLLDLATIARICTQFTDQSVVIVDEAYIEFAETESATTLLSQFENLVILRTLSKAYGLAGLRLGCVIADESIINTIKKIMSPYYLPSPVTALAIRALNDNSWFETSIKKIILSREKLIHTLKKSALINTVYPGRGNFVLIKSCKAAELAVYFSANGVAVRSFGPMSPMLRITVGTDSQNQQLMTLLENLDGCYEQNTVY